VTEQELEELVTGTSVQELRGLKEPAPVIKLNQLADSSVNFVVRVWAPQQQYWNVYWDITRAVKLRFDAEGITIPYPQRELHVNMMRGSLDDPAK